MTKVTTSVVLVSPKAIGSFGDESSWRIGLTCQVVDGGSNGPFLLCDMPGRTQHAIPWQDLTDEAAVSAVLFALCLYFGDGPLLGILEATHNIIIENSELTVAPFYDFAPEVRWQLFERLRNSVKIAFIELEKNSSLTADAMKTIQDNGISAIKFEQSKA